MTRPSRVHALRRTSPKGPGQPFIGTCAQCGATNVTLDDMAKQECPNVRGISEAEALIEAINPPSPEPTP